MVYLPKSYEYWATVSSAFWMPTYLFRILQIPVLPESTINLLQTVWKLSLLLSSIGLFTRINSIIACLVGVYLLGLPHNFGKIHHFDGIIVLSLVVMALSRCGDSCSIDQVIRKKFHQSYLPAESSGEYTWPVHMIRLLLSIVFFSAGLAKLRQSGVEWMFSDNFEILLIQHTYHLANENPLVSWGPHLAQYSLLCKMLAIGTIVIELSYPLALFSRPARYILVPGMVLLLIGIRLLMGPTFYPFMICSLFWVPWDRVYAKLGLQKIPPQLGNYPY
jgi:uncharacterized membrane protein YphA (DoxX/SURF4 family)/uncharacterized membrane protein